MECFAELQLLADVPVDPGAPLLPCAQGPSSKQFKNWQHLAHGSAFFRQHDACIAAYSSYGMGNKLRDKAAAAATFGSTRCET